MLALHDYYTDKLSKVGSETPTVDRGSQGSIPSPPAPSPRPLKSGTSTVFRRQDDKWALAYINAAYVQPILEAVDDDGTGFVSVKEVNTFVGSRPDGWRSVVFCARTAPTSSRVKLMLILHLFIQLAPLDCILGSWLASKYISLQEQDIHARSNHVPNVGVRVAFEQTRGR